MIARNLLALGTLMLTTSCSSGPSQGAVGGPCFPNNTCNTGLVCTIVNGSALCEQPDATSDATVDAPADAPTMDAPADAPATDAASDGSLDAGKADACSGAVSVLCAGKNCGNSGCCAGALPPACSTGTCPDGLGAWACTQKSDCSGGKACCVGVTISDSTTCPWAANYYTAPAQCQTACSAGYLAVCASNADCPSTQTCTPTDGVANGTIGLCQ